MMKCAISRDNFAKDDLNDGEFDAIDITRLEEGEKEH